MAIKYINQLTISNLRDSKSNYNSPETSFKNLSFGDQSVDNSLSKLNNFSSISSINLFKDESEQSNASLQNSINCINQNLNKQKLNESFDDYQNGFRDCYKEVIKFLSDAKRLQSNDRLNEHLIIDLRAYLDSTLKKQSNQLNNNKRRVDFSPKSYQSVDGLQIKLEEMDVEESSVRMKNKQNGNEKLSFEDKFPKLSFNNCCSNSKPTINSNNSNHSVPMTVASNLNLSTANLNNTLKNYLTNTDLLKTDYRKNNFTNSNLDLNPTIKSRSLTSSPNSSNLDSGYKFKSSIKEKFDAEFNNSKLSKLDHLTEMPSKQSMSRPRSATVGANASSIRRLNNALELKEKIVNSNAELNADRLDKSIDNKLGNLNALNNLNDLSSLNNQQLKSCFTKKMVAGFILHPNQAYYVPVEIDLNNNLTQASKPNLFNQELLFNLQNFQKLNCLNNLSTNLNNLSTKQPQLNHQLNLQLNQNAFLNTINGSQNSLNQFQEHLSFSSPSLNSLNSINNSSLSGYPNQQAKCCLDDKFLANDQEATLYPISISVNFKTSPLSLNATIVNSQKSSI